MEVGRRGCGLEAVFYPAAKGRMIAALVTTGAHFDPGGQPVSTADLFDYDVSRGGQRFLINTGVKHAEGAPMSVVLNWAAKLNK